MVSSWNQSDFSGCGSSDRVFSAHGSSGGVTEPPAAEQGGDSCSGVRSGGDSCSGSSSDTSLGINTNYVTPPLVTRYMLQAAARELLPAERVAKCLRVPISSSVQVLYSAAVKAAHYRGLMICGSIWTCPVCASKISERRRVELQEALGVYGSSGGRVVMATFTMQHSDADSLQSLLTAFLGALRRLRQGAAWERVTSRFGVVGSVRALEVTHGGSGWHPHAHVLFFLPKDVDLDGLTVVLRKRWLSFLNARGFDASWDIGLDIREADNLVGDYVAKLGSEWTIAHELTKANIKRAAGANRSMAQLLVDYIVLGDSAAGLLWSEYAKLFKGKRHLQWTDGLRARLLPDKEELTDEALAAEVDQTAVLLALLTLDQWRVVVANDARAELLLVAAGGDAGAVQAFLRGLGI